MEESFDFSGYATKNDLKCTDGRTIRKDAFKHNDGRRVPLVWQHMHDSPSNVLGFALLKNRPDGVYAYGKFNDTSDGKKAKILVAHGDVCALSIFANHLQQKGGDVLHGEIREVSLVLAGANPGALIDRPILAHGEESEEEAVIYTGEYLIHSNDCNLEDDDIDGTVEEESEEIEENPEEMPEEGVEHSEKGDDEKMAETNEKTIKDVFDELTEEQKTVVYFMIGQAVEDAKNEMNHSDEEETMKYNAFENDVTMLQHDGLTDEQVSNIFKDAQRYGSLKESVLQHADEYGIGNIEYLFPEDRTVNGLQFIKREDTWVTKFLNAVHHTPFARIRSIWADITEEDARAKGYLKGNMKKEEFFTLMKRTTSATTVYKKQKMNRDDLIDADFEVAAMLKGEMRGMLDEELVRAMMIGDGRSSSSDDKINEQCIRPIWTDDDLFSVKATISLPSTATEEDMAKAFIKGVIRARKNYKGSGTPTLWCSEDMLSSMLLIEDNNGRFIYESVDKLATVLRVKEIVTVELFENLTRTVDGVTRTLRGIIVNPADYNVGADKGGSVNMFEDFDIDYNQQKYLIETRCSGALTKPHTALVMESVVSNG